MTLMRAECSMIPVLLLRREVSVGEDAPARLYGERLGPLRAPDWVPCDAACVKADHLAPSHCFASASALARSAGLISAKASSSIGSPLPAVFATICHFSPSTLSTGAPWPPASTQASRFWAIGLFCLAALRSSATAAGWFRGVPLPL